MIKKVLWIFLLLLAQIGIAQEFDSQKMDSYFDVLEAHDKFMGSVALSIEGKIVYTRSVGYADIEAGKKADKNTRYCIGSISKTFTAALIMKAVELEKLKLDQTLDAYFPSVPGADVITISDLLYHRSGIYNFTYAPDYFDWNTKVMSQDEMIEIISKGDLEFKPDTKSSYSNSNYVLLSYILEKVFDDSFGGVLEKYIVKPLNLKSTYFNDKREAKENESKSYKYVLDWELEPHTDVSVPMGAGGIISTPIDLATFSNALFRGDLLSKESVEQMKTVKEDYGMGLFPMPFYNSWGFGHTGGIDGFSSVFVYMPDIEMSYAYTSNGSNYPFNNISIAVLSAAYGKPYSNPEFSDFVPDSADLDAYEGTYVSEEIGLSMIIKREEQALTAQIVGQASFPLEAIERDRFQYEVVGVVIEFDRENSSLTLKQLGNSIELKKK